MIVQNALRRREPPAAMAMVRLRLCKEKCKEK
jgi:hypothetical protein